MKTAGVLGLLVLAFTFATAIKPRSQFTRYRSWNQRMYPVWKDGDVRFRNCWFGGEVTFDLKNDAPTLTGAKATFNINLNFPPNQTTLSDGQVVWAQNCTINGQQYQEGQAVYPDQDTQSTGVFPDGTPFSRSQNKKPHYVFVWKAWGRYWQVADGPSSSLTIGTDNVPLGSHNMELVIYHCRGKDKFIPLGYASTVFTITDQVPFAISLAQVNDVNQDDQNFIQNRAIAFSVKVHDPSQYLNSADVSFSWDFGDSTGTLISRELTVTHTYLAVGSFKPQVVLMASIPNGCENPTAVVVMASTPAAVPAAPAEGGDAIALDVPASVQPAEAEDGEAVVDTDTEAVEVASVAPAVVDAAVVPADTAVPAAEADVAAQDADAAAGEVATAAPVAPAAEEPADADAAAIDAAAADADAAAAATTDAAAADADADADATDAAAADADATDADVTDADATDADAAAADADAAAADATDADAVAADADAAADETAVVTDATEENAPVIDAAASVAPVAEGEEAAVEVVGAVTVAPAAEVAVEQEADLVAADTAAADVDAAAAVDDVAAAVDAATEVVQAETEAPADNVVAPAATETTAVEEAAPADDAEAEVQATENEVAATAAPAAVAAEGEVQAEVEAEPAQVALVLAKRQAPELTADCMVYRYGSVATAVDVVQGIESVEIVQMSNVVALTTALDQNAVDVTITCQGSLPSEVCTVISDADCITPMETICGIATPSPDCQMILRQFFNDSGVFCINVSLTNDVSFAVASARVSVTVASGGSPAGTAATVLGVMVLACVVCCIGLMYRRFKQYQPLREDGDSNGSSAVTSVPLLLWNLLSRQSPGESRPLLQGRIV
ncbi:premelanosome protein a isoform X2 [Sebastes fasciatus]|uniref:premelanosome protein a isoform X2 n=1 Tax=Sebastes fasciatus TaxID=394691 RepID=UPI003D9DE4BF